MQDFSRNIVLIGMPGAGKSTVGVILAKTAGFLFLDTDIVIQEREHMTLQNIIDTRGLDGFLAAENETVSGISTERCVIATGGSVVYGKDAVANLKKNGVFVYLKLTPETIAKRLANIKTRGVVIKKGQNIQELYEERRPLYEKYADITVSADSLNTEETVEEIILQVGLEQINAFRQGNEQRYF